MNSNPHINNNGKIINTSDEPLEGSSLLIKNVNSVEISNFQMENISPKNYFLSNIGGPIEIFQTNSITIKNS